MHIRTFSACMPCAPILLPPHPPRELRTWSRRFPQAAGDSKEAAKRWVVKVHLCSVNMRAHAAGIIFTAHFSTNMRAHVWSSFLGCPFYNTLRAHAAGIIRAVSPPVLLAKCMFFQGASLNYGQFDTCVAEIGQV